MARNGRPTNEWTHVTWSDIQAHLDTTGLAKSAFASQVGVTSQTMHNWSKGRSAPNDSMQQKIKNLIEEKTDMAKKKTGSTLESAVAASSDSDKAPAAEKATKKRTKKVRATASAGGKKKTTKKVSAAPAAEAAAPAAEKKAGRKPGPRRGRKTATKPAEPSTAGGWNELSHLSSFLSANPGKSKDELLGIIEIAEALSR